MARLDYTDIKAGVFFKMNGVVYETLESSFSKKSRQKGSNQVRIKNLSTGAVTSKTLHTSDTVEDVDLEKKDFIFIYRRGEEAVVHALDDKSNRITININSIPGVNFLPADTKITGLMYDDEVLTIRVPIRVNLKVKEAPPNIKGNTAQGGSKHVTVETGEVVSTPLFIETGDIIAIKTETGEYMERVQKN